MKMGPEMFQRSFQTSSHVILVLIDLLRVTLFALSNTYRARKSHNRIIPLSFIELRDFPRLRSCIVTPTKTYHVRVIASSWVTRKR